VKCGLEAVDVHCGEEVLERALHSDNGSRGCALRMDGECLVAVVIHVDSAGGCRQE